MIFGHVDAFAFSPGFDNWPWMRTKSVLREFENRIKGFAWFSIFAFSALEFERTEFVRNKSEAKEDFSKSIFARQENGTILQSVVPILLARLNTTLYDTTALVKECQLSLDQVAVVDAWCSHKRSFLDKSIAPPKLGAISPGEA